LIVLYAAGEASWESEQRRGLAEWCHTHKQQQHLQEHNHALQATVASVTFADPVGPQP
jgi:hypothetical protein